MDSIPTIPMHEEAYWQDPYPVLREIREKHRLARTDQGLIAILRALYSGLTLREVLAVDAPAELQRLGLNDHLSAQRSNGLRAMVQRLRDIALAAQSR